MGGITWVKYPTLSGVKAVLLYPLEESATAPKFELEFVRLISPPDSVTKCSEYPIANTDTIWRTPSFITLIWEFLYEGLYLAFEFVLSDSFPPTAVSYTHLTLPTTPYV